MIIRCRNALAALGLVLAFAVAAVSPARAAPIVVPQDIVFVIDGSGSLGQSGFDNEIDFVIDLIQTYGSDPLHPTRFGALLFSSGAPTTVYNLTDDQTPSTITGVLNGLSWPQGQTYTKDAVQGAIDMFDAQSDAANPKMMILITDGNPFPSSSQNPCGLKTDLDAADIQGRIIGSGSGLNVGTIACLVDDAPTQFVEITDYAANFDLQQGYVLNDEIALPEPAMGAIMALGLGVLAAARRRKI